MESECLRRRGLMLVLSSPSGAGKTTISRRLLQVEPNLTMSISLTTRPRRPSEVDGRDYLFVDDAEFERRRTGDELLESAVVFGHRYGTPRAAVDDALADGRDVLFDVDWQGTQQLKEKVRHDIVSVFILPPSRSELERRLHARAQDAAEVVRQRMAKAADEMSHWIEYDYVVVNDDLERSLGDVRAILAAERRRSHRQIGVSDFVKSLSVPS